MLKFISAFVFFKPNKNCRNPEGGLYNMENYKNRV